MKSDQAKRFAIVVVAVLIGCALVWYVVDRSYITPRQELNIKGDFFYRSHTSRRNDFLKRFVRSKKSKIATFFSNLQVVSDWKINGKPERSDQTRPRDELHAGRANSNQP